MRLTRGVSTGDVRGFIAEGHVIVSEQLLRAGGRATAGEAAWRYDEPVIAVDDDDNVLGIVSRRKAHDGDGVLHRAFMTLLFDGRGGLLLARRSAFKRLWALAWADSCAGHPRPGESVVEAARRRIGEELGCSAEVLDIGSFHYHAAWSEAGVERELCHVLVGRATGRMSPDPAEVSEVRDFRLAELDLRLRENPGDFAPWLVECLSRLPLAELIETSDFS